MSGGPWAKRPITSAYEAGLVLCADFAAAAKAAGDMGNYYRWRNELAKARKRASPAVMFNPRADAALRKVVAETQQKAQLLLM